MRGLRIFLAFALYVLIVVALAANTINAIENDSVQSAFFAGIFFWIIIDYAFKAMVIDKINGVGQ